MEIQVIGKSVTNLLHFTEQKNPKSFVAIYSQKIKILYKMNSLPIKISTQF